VIRVNGWEQTGAEVLHWNRPTRLSHVQGTVIMDYENTGTEQASCKLFITTDAEFQLFRGGDDTDLVVGINNVNTANLNFTDNIFTSSHVNQISVRYDKNASTTYKVKANGQTITDATAIPAGDPTHATFNILNRDNGQRHARGISKYCLVWNRVLSDNELERIEADPRQVLMSRAAFQFASPVEAAVGGRVMGSLAAAGGLAGKGGLAGSGGGLAG